MGTERCKGLLEISNIIASVALRNVYEQRASLCSAEWMSNLFVEPEHGAGHSDVSKADPLSHQEGTGVQVLVQQCKCPLYVLLGLLCSLTDPDRRMTMQDYNT